MNKILLLLTLFISACTTQSKLFDKKHNYKQVLEANTRQDKKYSGINNLYQVSVTHLNQDVMNLKNQKLAFLQHWPSHKVEDASEKQQEMLSKTSQFIVILYSPNARFNDLAKGSNSIWRTYLKVDDQRYQGLASRVEETDSQINSLIPNTSRFSKAYKIQFPISSNETSTAQSLKFILASDIGTTELNFR